MSTCEVTIPGFLKRLLDPSISDSTVCCSDTSCTKTFSNSDIFERELSVYRLQLPYIPRLIAHDRKTLSITTERVGKPIGTVWDSGIPMLRTLPMFSKERRFDARIRKLHRKFRRDSGLYHNDICYKNVLVTGDETHQRLYLIDFERAAKQNKDPNMDGILNRSTRRHMRWLTVYAFIVVIAVVYITRSER